MRILASLSLLTACFAASHGLLAQSQWAAADMPGQSIGLLRHIYSNPAKDTIYLAGSISLNDSLGWQQTNAVMRYSNSDWDTLGVLNGQVFTVVQYHDTLVAGGLLLECSGVPCQGTAYWDGAVWREYGALNGTVRMLRVFDGELYAVGSFNQADGLPATGVAMRVGNSWVPVGAFNLQGSIIDIAKYNGKLVVIGNVDFDNGRSIAEWDGSEWHLLGPGILNAMSSGQCLAVYQGDLYVGGQIALALPGNPGQNIMRWDGTQFHALGQGIQWYLGNTTSIATVMEMVEHDGKLFVGGGYRAAGGVEALGLATWDGIEWCGVHGDFQASGGIWGMDFYHDTLFVACGLTLDGDTVNRVAKFIGTTYESVCSGPVSTPEHVIERTLVVVPNPGKDQLRINGLPKGPSQVEVRDLLGRVVRSERSNADTLVLETSEWPVGTYVITVFDTVGMRELLRWMKQ